jgi:hypothetical protein
MAQTKKSSAKKKLKKTSVKDLGPRNPRVKGGAKHIGNVKYND